MYLALKAAAFHSDLKDEKRFVHLKHAILPTLQVVPNKTPQLLIQTLCSLYPWTIPVTAVLLTRGAEKVQSSLHRKKYES